jgi:hypothetical protein
MGFSQMYALYSRSVTDSGATNFSNSSNLVRFFSSSQTIAAGWTVSGSSIGATYSFGTGTTNGSSSVSYSSNSSAMVGFGAGGKKIFQVPFVTSLTQGEYWMAHALRSTVSTAGNTDASRLLSISNLMAVTDSNNSYGLFGNAASSTLGILSAQGFYSVTSNGFPTSVAPTEITAQPFNQTYWQLQG